MLAKSGFKGWAGRVAYGLLFTGALLNVVSVAEGKKFPLTAAASVPAAEGEINIGKDKNGNTNIELKVKHLAKPDRLSPAKSAYLVWLKASGGEVTPAGQLSVNGKLEGSFKTVTPLRTFDVVITAEDDLSVKAPSGVEVFHGSVQQ